MWQQLVMIWYNVAHEGFDGRSSLGMFGLQASLLGWKDWILLSNMRTLVYYVHAEFDSFTV